MKTHREVELQLHHSLPQRRIQESALLYAPDSLAPGTHCTNGWVHPRRRKIPCTAENRTPMTLSSSPHPSRYTDWAVPALSGIFRGIYLKELRKTTSLSQGTWPTGRDAYQELPECDISLGGLRIISKWHSNSEWLKCFLVGSTATTVSGVGWDLRFWSYGYEGCVTWDVTQQTLL